MGRPSLAHTHSRMCTHALTDPPDELMEKAQPRLRLLLALLSWAHYRRGRSPLSVTFLTAILLDSPCGPDPFSVGRASRWAHVCVHVCACVCACMCVYIVCIHVHVCACVRTCASVHVCAFVQCVCMCACVHVLCVRVCAFVHCVCKCVHAGVRIRMHALCVHVRVHVCMCACACVHVHVHALCARTHKHVPTRTMYQHIIPTFLCDEFCTEELKN